MGWLRWALLIGFMAGSTWTIVWDQRRQLRHLTREFHAFQLATEKTLARIEERQVK